jgi:hypothetical protein
MEALSAPGAVAGVGQSGLVVKPNPQLYKNFARIEVMRPAERKAVVQQYAAVRDIKTLHTHRKPFAETLSERKIKGRMGLKMISWDRRITVGES